MIGTLLNGAAILAGGIVGRTAGQKVSAQFQQRLKLILGAFSIYVGFATAWSGLKGSVGHFIRQSAIVLLALIVGKAIGLFVGIQRRLNKLGKYAKQRFADAQSSRQARFSDGFVACTVLYCVAPMALLGALQDGLKGDFRILAIKSAMDGLATLAFVQSFGWSVLGSAFPVVVYQGTITLAARALAPFLDGRELADPVSAAAGFILLAVSLVILELKKVELSDYLPSLILAPALTWLFR